MSNGKVIVVTAQKGGTGKSAATSHIAHGLKRRGYKVVVLDTDRKSTLKNGLDSRHNYFDLDVISKVMLEDYPLVKKVTTHDPLDLILQSARDKYDFIFIDTPGKLESFEAEMIGKSDYALMVVGASEIEFRESYDVVKVTNAIAERHGKTIPTIGVLQRVDPRDKILNDYIRELVLERAYGLQAEMSNNSLIKILESVGFTAYDALEHASVMTKVLQIDWDRKRVSTISKRRAQDTVEEVESVIDELLDRIDTYEHQS